MVQKGQLWPAKNQQRKSSKMHALETSQKGWQLSDFGGLNSADVQDLADSRGDGHAEAASADDAQGWD